MKFQFVFKCKDPISEYDQAALNKIVEDDEYCHKDCKKSEANLNKIKNEKKNKLNGINEIVNEEEVDVFPMDHKEEIPPKIKEIPPKIKTENKQIKKAKDKEINDSNKLVINELDMNEKDDVKELKEQLHYLNQKHENLKVDFDDLKKK